MHPYPTIIRYVAKNLTFIQPLTGEAPGIWRQWGRLPPSSRVPRSSQPAWGGNGCAVPQALRGRLLWDVVVEGDDREGRRRPKAPRPLEQRACCALLRGAEHLGDGRAVRGVNGLREARFVSPGFLVAEYTRR